MTKNELIEKINSMKSAAENMDEPEKTFSLSDIRQLEIEVMGMSVSSIAEKMQAVNLPSVHDMDSNIKNANNSTIEHSQRVGYLNSAISLVKEALNIVV
ncbi:hypothetical protein [Marinobacter sp. DY40_1A1]|uniref:hypothetical protein n=1 Tax=Marinobacter sp. DY40_1A1 TaxID=2583229 RepID=UPI0019079BDE|nr:hypothetical protein [Marinobacter sp. DY40_1A1]MBK1887769.1 hypothetical protein [Marinobacter sp. DY40_1A1]